MVDRDRRVLGLITVAGIAGLLRETAPGGAPDAPTDATGASASAGAADAPVEAPEDTTSAAPDATTGSPG